MRIEYPVGNFDPWKQAFDTGPIGRQQSGVEISHIMHRVDNPNRMMVDLLFETVRETEVLLAALLVLWRR